MVRSLICLPCYEGLSDDDQTIVIDAVQRFFREGAG
jgi:hypothetical protein